jgi:hypothetical protein
MSSDALKRVYLTRDEILEFLSDEELARVSTMEEAPRLAVGEEYIDLTRLHQGVRLVQARSEVTTARMLPRSAVSDETWSGILALLAG